MNIIKKESLKVSDVGMSAHAFLMLACVCMHVRVSVCLCVCVSVCLCVCVSVCRCRCRCRQWETFLRFPRLGSEVGIFLFFRLLSLFTKKLQQLHNPSQT